MEFIKKHEIRVEYFDDKLRVIAGITHAEREELDLLSGFRTSGAATYQCTERANVVLRAAFEKIEKVIRMKGYEYELVELAGHEGLFARNKRSGKIIYRIHTDDKVPGG